MHVKALLILKLDTQKWEIATAGIRFSVRSIAGSQASGLPDKLK